VFFKFISTILEWKIYLSIQLEFQVYVVALKNKYSKLILLQSSLPITVHKILTLPSDRPTQEIGELEILDFLFMHVMKVVWSVAKMDVLLAIVFMPLIIYHVHNVQKGPLQLYLTLIFVMNVLIIVYLV